MLRETKRTLKDEGYIPVLFDFKKPSTRDLTETISALAHLARFVIVDLSDAKSIPQELQAIVPNLPSVPVQPIILESDREYAMFEHFRRYPWVREVFVYRSISHLVRALTLELVPPLEEMTQQFLGKIAMGSGKEAATPNASFKRTPDGAA